MRRSQPNSVSMGMNSTPVEERNAAAETSASSVTNATHHARCMRFMSATSALRVGGGGTRAVGVPL